MHSINSMCHVLYLFFSTVQWERDPVKAYTKLVLRRQWSTKEWWGAVIVAQAEI